MHSLRSQIYFPFIFLIRRLKNDGITNGYHDHQKQSVIQELNLNQSEPETSMHFKSAFKSILEAFPPLPTNQMSLSS
jgi:hypothetical protein